MSLRGVAAIVGIGSAGTGEGPGRTAMELLAASALAAIEDAGLTRGDIDGMLAVNTNGGGLSCTHPGMYGMFLIIEAVTQLRGEAGERQVPGLEVALVHGNGGTLSSQSTALLGTSL